MQSEYCPSHFEAITTLNANHHLKIFYFHIHIDHHTTLEEVTKEN